MNRSLALEEGAVLFKTLARLIRDERLVTFSVEGGVLQGFITGVDKGWIQYIDKFGRVGVVQISKVSDINDSGQRIEDLIAKKSVDASVRTKLSAMIRVARAFLEGE